MKILLIDAVCGVGSTGRICATIAQLLHQRGDQAMVAYGRDQASAQCQAYAVRIGSRLGVYAHALRARLTDGTGYGSRLATRRFLRWVDRYDPDLIHLHDLHSYSVNIPMLFRYLKKQNKPVVWTFHDCWAYTGHCAHYDYNNCQKWQTGCSHCPHISEYPKSLLDRSRHNYRLKKELFTALQKLHITVPSQWLAQETQKSFMGDFPIHVFPSGIDLQKFRANQAITKRQLGIEGKFLILAVASQFGEMKGIRDILALAQQLPRETYAIMLVGALEPGTRLPEHILHIPKTDDVTQLCSYYTLADLFINPTYQETQGLTTLEALACGTPALVYASGGTAECLTDRCGISVPRGDLAAFRQAIEQVQSGELAFAPADCLAAAQHYDHQALFGPILNLYDELCDYEQKA